MRTEWIDKVEVVNRQIIEAVRLFFNERDSVAIHTLIASAHQILFDLGKQKNIQSALKNTASLRKSEVQKFIRKINYPYNFFKHADKDPNSKINILPLVDLTVDFIFDAIVMLQQISGELPYEAKIYWLWFVSKYNEGFDNLPADSETRKFQEVGLGNLEFKDISKFIYYIDKYGGIDKVAEIFNT